MQLESLVAAARAQGASDLHLEPGLPPALRIRGSIKTAGEPVPAKTLLEMAREILGAEQWARFVERRSFDLSRTIQGVRCRINILQTSRGIGFAIRLLASFQATLDKLNLHPDLRKLVTQSHGLILLSGPTGCGKSSTMAALLQEINLTDARHIVTIECPIEYAFRPRLSYIRQREVGRDTPSFQQALIDALREDPDVLMVGEMRAEALQRLTSAFPSEIQNAVRAQLADCLVAVICQRLRYRPDLKIRVPELEILIPTIPVKSYIRNGDFFKIIQLLETGAEQGMWTWQRYQNWLEKKKDWHIPDAGEQADSEPTEAAAGPVVLPPVVTSAKPAPAEKDLPAQRAVPTTKPGHPIEIEPVEGGLSELIKRLEGQ